MRSNSCQTTRSSFLPMHRTTMTGTNSSTSQRNWKTNSFSMMVASSSCQTQLRGSDSCTRWNGLNLCADRRRIASYIPCGVSLRQRIVFGSSTSSLPDDAVPLSGGGVWLAGSSQGVALATVGLLVPLHALFWKLSRWIVAGTVRRHWAFKGNCGYAWFALRFCATTCIWALPVLTYIVVRSLEMNGGSENEMEGALFCHFTVCCIGAGIILFMPAHSEDLVWPLTPTSWRRVAVRYLFWGGVLTLKFLVSMNGVRAMYQTTT